MTDVLRLDGGGVEGKGVEGKEDGGGDLGGLRGGGVEGKEDSWLSDKTARLIRFVALGLHVWGWMAVRSKLCTPNPKPVQTSFQTPCDPYRDTSLTRKRPPPRSTIES